MQTNIVDLLKGRIAEAKGPPPKRPVGRPKSPKVEVEAVAQKRPVGRPRKEATASCEVLLDEDLMAEVRLLKKKRMQELDAEIKDLKMNSFHTRDANNT